MVARLPNTQVIEHPFVLRGEVFAGVAMSKATPDGRVHTPTRPLAGWLMVYALLGKGDALHPIKDREGHVMEAASELGRIDWTNYLAKGMWNDTHTDRYVGVGTDLQFCDATHPLAKAHRKVGYWTAGHLWDRDDPSSWELYGAHRPNEIELAKADRFWGLARALEGTPRPLGFSAHGVMAVSPCGSRILYARCDENAVCELPMNPGATVEVLRKALEGSPLEWMRKGMVDRHDRPCGACACPEGSACLALAKAGNGKLRGDSESIDLKIKPGEVTGDHSPGTEWEQLSDADVLIELIMRRFFVDRDSAVRWVRSYLSFLQQEAT